MSAPHHLVRPSPLIAMLGMLAGCAASGTYPSLALRPIETGSFAEPTLPAPLPGTAIGAADARYAPHVEQARAGDATFRRALAEVRPVLARGRGAAIGSDDWAAAQTALSRLQAARDPVAQALLALEAASETPETHADTGLAAAAARALDAVATIDRGEADALRDVTPARS